MGTGGIAGRADSFPGGIFSHPCPASPRSSCPPGVPHISQVRTPLHPTISPTASSATRVSAPHARALPMQRAICSRLVKLFKYRPRVPEPGVGMKRNKEHLQQNWARKKFVRTGSWPCRPTSSFNFLPPKVSRKSCLLYNRTQRSSHLRSCLPARPPGAQRVAPGSEARPPRRRVRSALCVAPSVWKAELAVCIEQPTDMPLAFLLREVSEEMEKKKKRV